MPSRPSSRSFTLVEVLVAVALAILLLAALFSMMGQVSGVWRRSTGSIEAFQGARVGFDLMGRNLSQATLNAYVDYDNATNPAYYLRKSDLRFVVGAAGNGIPGTAGTGQAVFFQAPLHNVSTASRTSLDTLLNTCGYYVSFTTNATVPAHVAGTQNPYRYRLMQMLVPSEGNTIYGCTTNPAVIDNTWFTGAVPLGNVVPVADNVILLLVRAQDPAAAAPDLTSDYTYDSALGALANPQPVTAQQLPPVLQLTMVAIDEATSRRLAAGSTPPPAIAAALAGKFQKPSSYQADLDQLQAALASARIPYRVFSSMVPLRESKWTK